MNPLPTERDVDRFRTVIGERLGLRFDDSKLGFLADLLQRRTRALDDSCDAYLRRLADDTPTGELGTLAQDVTVPETYFFRNDEQFRALAELAVPDRMRANQSRRTLRILCAGCASGEEAYSIAMVARKAVADRDWEVVVRAVDVNPAALEKANAARYSAWALRNTPPALRERWFRVDGREFRLADDVRAAVGFELRNLAVADADLWAARTYDVIFFRNVMMYFTPEHMRAAVARAAGALAPGGFLFLGHAETLRGYSDAFHLRHTHETFYYQLKEGAGTVAEPPAPEAHPFSAAGVPDVIASDAWVETIRASSGRVAALVPGRAAAHAGRTAGAGATVLASSAWNVAGALDLLGKERFAEALAHVRGLPAESAADADVLLLEAALLAHAGETAGAEAVCRRLLAVDELNAGAHYVLALCHENAGHSHRAAEENRIAAYLDPAFAMPRLHLGLLARRAGDRDGARRELAHAMTLLKHEDASRLLLFGGGFTRASLLALCESAARDCGARA